MVAVEMPGGLRAMVPTCRAVQAAGGCVAAAAHAQQRGRRRSLPQVVGVFWRQLQSLFGSLLERVRQF